MWGVGGSGRGESCQHFEWDARTCALFFFSILERILFQDAGVETK